MRGGDFWQGAAAGFVSSLAGSGAQSIGIHGWGMVGVSAFSGGVGAAIAGGKAEEILFGILQGAMVGVLNHLQGEVSNKAWDLNSDGILQKNEADNWFMNGNGDIDVNGKNISLKGLKATDMTYDAKKGIYYLSTTKAFDCTSI